MESFAERLFHALRRSASAGSTRGLLYRASISCIAGEERGRARGGFAAEAAARATRVGVACPACPACVACTASWARGLRGEPMDWGKRGGKGDVRGECGCAELAMAIGMCVVSGPSWLCCGGVCVRTLTGVV
eukprot:6190845-Pleurochrysis_carterae.AAC.2